MRHSLKIEPMFFIKLTQKILWTLNGAGHELGVEHNIKGVDAEVPFRLLPAPVNFNNITQTLERVEREADGEHER